MQRLTEETEVHSDGLCAAVCSEVQQRLPLFSVSIEAAMTETKSGRCDGVVIARRQGATKLFFPLPITSAVVDLNSLLQEIESELRLWRQQSEITGGTVSAYLGWVDPSASVSFYECSPAAVAGNGV